MNQNHLINQNPLITTTPSAMDPSLPHGDTSRIPSTSEPTVGEATPGEASHQESKTTLATTSTNGVKDGGVKENVNPHNPVPQQPLPQIHRESLAAALVQQCQHLFFRQSFLKDYLTCPQMALYRWVINLASTPPFFAAVCGTAGHAVIETMHRQQTFSLSSLSILDLFTTAFREELQKLEILPEVPAGHDSLELAMAARANDYVEMLVGYQSNDRNRQFHALMVEQLFTLEIPNPNINPLTNEPYPNYLFTGMIDQAGVYHDGLYVIRDIKFREDPFRPTRVEFNLDIQMTTYAAAVAYGNPACGNCRPRYEKADIFDLSPRLVYKGPCPACRLKIGTPQWPRRFAERCEMIWMRDFAKYEKNQYSMYIDDKTLPKVLNPITKKFNIAQRINPNYLKGYKIGDQRGEGFIRTYREKGMLDVLMSDLLRICDQIQQGVFYRLPGKHCNQWCGYTEQCFGGAELQAAEANLVQLAATMCGGEEPF